MDYTFLEKMPEEKQIEKLKQIIAGKDKKIAALEKAN